LQEDAKTDETLNDLEENKEKMDVIMSETPSSTTAIVGNANDGSAGDDSEMA
jgi:hypothetical protein